MKCATLVISTVVIFSPTTRNSFLMILLLMILQHDIDSFTNLCTALIYWSITISAVSLFSKTIFLVM